MTSSSLPNEERSTLGIPELIIILAILLTIVAPALLAFIAWKLVRKPES